MVIYQVTTKLLLSKMHHQGGNKSILNALETTQNGLLLNRDSGVRVGSQKRVLLVTNGPATENLQSLTWAAKRDQGTRTRNLSYGPRRQDTRCQGACRDTEFDGCTFLSHIQYERFQANSRWDSCEHFFPRLLF